MQKERGVSVWSYSAISGVIAFNPCINMYTWYKCDNPRAGDLLTRNIFMTIPTNHSGDSMGCIINFMILGCAHVVYHQSAMFFSGKLWFIWWDCAGFSWMFWYLIFKQIQPRKSIASAHFKWNMAIIPVFINYSLTAAEPSIVHRHPPPQLCGSHEESLELRLLHTIFFLSLLLGWGTMVMGSFDLWSGYKWFRISSFNLLLYHT